LIDDFEDYKPKKKSMFGYLFNDLFNSLKKLRLSIIIRKTLLISIYINKVYLFGLSFKIDEFFNKRYIKYQNSTFLSCYILVN